MNCKNCKAPCAHKGEDYKGKCLVGYEPMTNADKIRNMTDSELAHVLWIVATGGAIRQRSEEQWLEWLKKEVKENAN